MKSITVIIPNYNGMKYLGGCLSSLRAQTDRDFDVIMIDNGSSDGSVSWVREHYPEVGIRAFHRNTGFARAANEGIRLSKTPYVLLLNNDVVCGRRMVEELHRSVRRSDKIFSCCARLVRMDDPSKLDDAGDFYTAMGWAFARGKGKNASMYADKSRVFACCAAAAIYRRDLLEKTGLFDERHFAYLEDIDLGYRALILGYENVYVPAAVVRHAGSATSGSRHNSFKVRLAARNSLWVIKKNMPAWQIILNAPFIISGTVIKALYFASRGLGKDYCNGISAGLRGLDRIERAPEGHAFSYMKIQIRLLSGMALQFVDMVRQK